MKDDVIMDAMLATETLHGTVLNLASTSILQEAQGVQVVNLDPSKLSDALSTTPKTLDSNQKVR
jgi:hypothetical protein